MNAQVLGISVDPLPTLIAWAKDLGGIHFPLLSDFWPHGVVSDDYGILRSVGYSERAIFIVDHEGALRYQKVYDSGIQPDNDEILAELRALEPGSERPVVQKTLAELEQIQAGITMYCSPYCGDCRKARAWLAEKGLEYTEIDVYRVEGASDRVREYNDDNLVLPTFDIEGEIVPDFDPERLSIVLRKYQLISED